MYDRGELLYTSVCMKNTSPLPGILLTNIGSPAAPTPEALRTYLAEFLGDPRVIQLPGWLWKPILHGVILRTRPRRSARLYHSIWTPDGSPLLQVARKQVEGLRRLLQERTGLAIPVEIGMRYGEPSIARGLNALNEAGAERVLVFPLFPQYSATTTESTFDAVADAPARGELRQVLSYAINQGYIEALAKSVRLAWRNNGLPDRLLFSFHGLPESYARAGDPYPDECKRTAWLVADRLDLAPKEWAIAYQSRFGPVRWLQPYTDRLLARWGEQGVGTVHVICPGFSADCLETLEEINVEGREIFLKAGGTDFHYIPALNHSPDHLAALADIALLHLADWVSEAAPQHPKNTQQ